jgi:cystathionine beta-lyase
MWVADMDFRVAEPIISALENRVKSGIFGYAAKTPGYLSAVINWMQRRHGWTVDEEWVMPTVGIVPALHMIVRQFTNPGDDVLIQRPVYYPFSYAVENNQRKVISNSLCLKGERYEMDFDDLEVKIRQSNITLAILSNPHNPVGRVWSIDELSRFAEICYKNEILVVSDEIHGDLTLPGQNLTPYGRLDSKFVEKSIICTAASKAFNLAGLKTSNLVIRDPVIRGKMKQVIRASGLWGLNPLGLVATQAAYNSGEPWLKDAIKYIAGNHEFLGNYLRTHIPKLRAIPVESTYLAWIDCRELALDDDSLAALMIDNAKVYLDDGTMFGPEGAGFVRINLACPRSVLKQALDRIRTAVGSLL